MAARLLDERREEIPTGVAIYFCGAPLPFSHKGEGKKDVDGRVKPGHDGRELGVLRHK